MNKLNINKYLILICGLPGTGKTTLAKKLATRLKDYVLIDQNEIRRQQGMKRLPAKGAKGTNPDKASRTIDGLVVKNLQRGRGVIVEGGHRYRTRRHQFYGIASGLDRRVLVIEAVCPKQLSQKRMSARPNGDGLISDPNQTYTYDTISALWEDIGNDFSQGHSSHVSYLQFDSLNNKLNILVAQKGIVKDIKSLKKIAENK